MPVKFPDAAGEKYRPSNGTEGAIFKDKWCCRCTKDPGDGIGCDDIAIITMARNIDDPKYPSEWIYDQEGIPKCTEFEDING
jgi:hypothetical protein